LDVHGALAMKAQRRTAKTSDDSRNFDFFYSRPQNFLRVEIQEGDKVTVHADRDNFSEVDKESFVHYLVNEGFISGRYSAYSFAQTGLEWLISPNQHKESSRSPENCRARTFMVRLLCSGAILWSMEILFLYLRIPKR
jgi:hypothetical protein